jgi:hypothetical protein
MIADNLYPSTTFLVFARGDIQGGSYGGCGVVVC